MKDREVTILMNDLAADYDMFRMKEKPGKIRSLKRNLSQRVAPSLRSAHTQSDRTVLVPARPNSISRLS